MNTLLSILAAVGTTLSIVNYAFDGNKRELAIGLAISAACAGATFL